ncbi:helix-turn-helix domain-containing protein [Pseudonocardia abyssalis]|uniref:Helix-turn-helix transcriptional regulator n=1 Tax=Pseudonocardia abyssalis TaxID=2792008 RepID=A0ABS6UT23_9PSEU|nr:helix-turn-helix transcriptional regulator [Pseudonocardia abyssalis]MBW0117982.1 helix-turn-helix transcriptional regulator [Pseudonocardia abyssalis]MBW0135411.1 helix-turn-helix transcriptional regulator [Pseudonocardia abyssalis]
METAWERPAPGLREWVGAYTGYRTDPGPPSVHQGVPSAHLTFILCLDGKVEMLANPDPARPPGAFDALVAGLHDAPAQIASGAAQTGLQLRLTWRGTRALFGVPAGELAGDTVDLAALLGRRTGPLLERLADAGTWAERFARLDTALAGLVGDTDGVRPEVGYAWDRLQETGGALRIADLAREVGWSRRHLADQLRRETGLAPKAAARVIRFERACDRLRFTADPLATVAADCGYVDQAHLSRDFRDLAGQTATQWLGERAATAHTGSAFSTTPGRARGSIGP